jgi:hypothetical protein
MARITGGKGTTRRAGAKSGNASDGVIYDSEGKRRYGPEEAKAEAQSQFPFPHKGGKADANYNDMIEDGNRSYGKLQDKLGGAKSAARKLNKKNPLYDSFLDNERNAYSEEGEDDPNS